MAAVPSINSSALEAIADRNVRDVLKQVVSGWQVRNRQSGTGDNAFLTEADLKEALKKQSVVNVVANALVEAPKKTGVNYTPVGMLINALQADVLSDPFFIFLGERIKLVDAPTTGLIDQMIGAKNGIYLLDKTINDPTTGLYSELKGAGLRIGGAATGYATLSELKADAVSASATYTNQVKAQLGIDIVAGDVTQKTLRVQSDNALSNAINTIWAAVGDGQALTQMGSETIVNRSGASASSWSQVQATLRDPATGRLFSSIVGRTEFNVVNSKVTGLSGQYTVKIDAGGYVAGYGLASGVDINGRSYSKMYFRADTFAIGSPNGTVDPITGESAGAQVPFIVKTSPFMLNGQLNPAGVYMKDIFVANGSIDSLKVGYAAIDKAHIKDLSVDTFKIGDNAVTVPVYINGAGGTNHAAAGADGGMVRVGYVNATYPAQVSVVGIVTWQTAPGGEHTHTRCELRVATAETFMGQTDSCYAGFTSSHCGMGKAQLAAGSYLLEVWMGNDWTGGYYTLRNWSCIFLGVMK